MDELYQAQILSLAREVRDCAEIAHPTHTAQIKNPTCGDEVIVSLAVQSGIIEQIHIEVSGCALCEAGAGLLHQKAKGLSCGSIAKMADELETFLASEVSVSDHNGPAPSYLVPFTPIKAVKNRHKCVTLAFKAYQKAIGS